MTTIPKGATVTINGLDVTAGLIEYDEDKGYVVVRVYPMRSHLALLHQNKDGTRTPVTAKVRGIVQVLQPNVPVGPPKEWRSGMRPIEDKPAEA